MSFNEKLSTNSDKSRHCEEVAPKPETMFQYLNLEQISKGKYTTKDGLVLEIKPGETWIAREGYFFRRVVVSLPEALVPRINGQLKQGFRSLGRNIITTEVRLVFDPNENEFFFTGHTEVIGFLGFKFVAFTFQLKSYKTFSIGGYTLPVKLSANIK